jgi:hypothetical protein
MLAKSVVCTVGDELRDIMLYPEESLMYILLKALVGLVEDGLRTFLTVN